MCCTEHTAELIVARVPRPNRVLMHCLVSKQVKTGVEGPMFLFSRQVQTCKSPLQPTEAHNRDPNKAARLWFE